MENEPDFSVYQTDENLLKLTLGSFFTAKKLWVFLSLDLFASQSQGYYLSNNSMVPSYLPELREAWISREGGGGREGKLSNMGWVCMALKGMVFEWFHLKNVDFYGLRYWFSIGNYFFQINVSKLVAPLKCLCKWGSLLCSYLQYQTLGQFCNRVWKIRAWNRVQVSRFEQKTLTKRKMFGSTPPPPVGGLSNSDLSLLIQYTFLILICSFWPFYCSRHMSRSTHSMKNIS